MHSRGCDLAVKACQDLIDRISHDEDAIAFDPLPDEILFAALGVRQKKSAAMIDDPPVDLLRHSIVVATIAGLEVIDGDSTACRRQRGKTRIGIPENEDPI